MRLKTIKEADIKTKRVLIRVDYNVSLDNKQNVSDDTRIKQALPTIEYLLKGKAKVILVSHLGRPAGKPNKKYSLKKVAQILGKYLKRKVSLIDNFWQKEAIVKVNKASPEEIILLENIRFHPGEEANDQEFAKHLSAFADLFVNNAFGTAHRAHASVVGIASYLPAYAGLLLNKEIAFITDALNSSTGKLTVIIGGAKTPEKIRVIDSLLDKANCILLGGAVANTFLSTWGICTGCSLVDYEMIEMARKVIWKATQSQACLIMPQDVVVSNIARTRKPKILSYEQVPGHLSILDIGPETCKKYSDMISKAKKVIWNGPMGLFEDKRFGRGTQAILKSLVKNKGISIVGGGDTLAAIKDKKYLDKITHISTGGGAMLEFLEKGTLPGIEILKQSKNLKKD